MPNFFVAMRLIEQVSRPLTRAATAADRMSDSAEKMGAELITANAILVGTAAAANTAVGAMSVAAAGLEDSLARLATVTRATSTTQETALSNAEEAARSFSTQYTATANEVIQAQFQIATAGVAVREQIDATQSSFKLARATMGEFTQAAQLLGSFLNTFGRSAEFNYLTPAEKMEQITDRLATSVQRFQVTLPVLAESFKFIVGPASTLNLNLGEVTAALGVLNTAGFRGTLAGTALSNMFNKLDRAVDKLDLNPDRFIDLNGELKSLTSFLSEVNRALADKTPIEQQNKLIEVFDIRAGRVIKTLLDNINTLKKFSGELDVSRGATEEMANVVENTTSAAFQKMLNSIVNVATVIGKQLNDSIRPLLVLITDVVVSVEEWVKNNKVLATTIVTLGAAVVTATAAMVTYSVVVGSLAPKMLKLAAASRLAQIAFLPLKAILSAIAVSISAATLALAGLAAVVAGAAVITAGMIRALAGVNSQTMRTYISIDELNERFGNSIERTSRLASELTRLGKTIRDNIDLPIRGDRLFGNLPFAQAATQLKLDDPTITRSQAIQRAVSDIGGFTGIVKQLSAALGEGQRANLSFANTFAKIREATDRVFPSLNEVEKAAEFASVKLRAAELAAKALANGNEQANESILNSLSALDKLSANIDNVTRAGLNAQIFESLTVGLDALRNSSSQSIQELVTFFDKARGLARAAGSEFQFAERIIGSSGDEIRELTSNSASFFNLINGEASSLNAVRRQFARLSGESIILLESLRGIETAISQTSTSTKSVVNLFKNASLGGESFAEAQRQAADRVKEAERSFKAISDAVQFIERSIDISDPLLRSTAEFEKLQKFLEDITEVEIDLRTKINEANALREANRIYAIIDRQNKAFTTTQVEDLKRIGTAAADSIGKALSGGLRGSDIFTAASDDFKRLFIGDIQKEIGLLFGNRFKDQFRRSIDIARGVIEQAELGGNLLQGLQDGSLSNQINDAIQSAIPGIRQITGGDIFNLAGQNRLAEQFNDIFNDAGVALVTAGNRSAAILRQLQDVIGGGPGQGALQLASQATELRNLLQRASVTGATDAIRPVEDALSNVLAQLQRSGPPAAVQQITTATQQATGAINNSASTFATAVGSLVPAARGFISIIEEGFRRINNDGFNASASNAINALTGNGERNVNINFESRDGNINVEATGGGTDLLLDEDEIRQIVDDAKVELLKEVDEKLNRLEDELRSR